MLSSEQLGWLKEFRQLRTDRLENTIDKETYNAKLVALYKRVDPIHHDSWLSAYKEKMINAENYIYNCITELRVKIAEFEDTIIKEALA